MENTVNVNKPGTYKVVYEVTDSQGAKTIKTIIITVENNDKYIENESTNNSDDKQVTLPATGSTSSLPIVGSILVAIGGLFTSKKKNDKK
ncbi:LPXTG-motif cell wall-anchored protein [Clostridium sardiniense]|nr:LPXTG-motif cell wall-anchored protein [Clostridium sardiniense]